MPIDFAYAQARVQARHGRRLTLERWRALEASRSLAQYLHATRQTDMAPLVRHLATTSNAHEIERSLRHDWQAEVAGVAGWVPRPWRTSVTMTAWLPYLPSIQHLVNGGPVHAWMREDPALLPLLSAGQDAPADHRGRHAGVTLPRFDRGNVLEQWLSSFRVQSPACSSLAHLVRLVRQSMDSMQSSAPQPGDAANPYVELQQDSIRTMRRQTQQPVSVFCHLLLSALDFHRLRNGMLRRALLNDFRASA